MTSQDVRARIEREIAANWSRSNAHGCDLRRCLIEPVKKPCPDASKPGQFIDLWLVLEEDPIGRDGYKVVYDEQSNQFGLAFTTDNTYIGEYGETFFEAFDAM